VLKRKMIVLSLVVLMLISVGFSGVVGAMGYNSERPAQKGQGLELALEQGLITEAEYNEIVAERKERQEENRAERIEDGSRVKRQVQLRKETFRNELDRGLMQPEECPMYNRRGSFKNRR
jgi:hypothetical protein